jgi:hypothetical protein
MARAVSEAKFSYRALSKRVRVALGEALPGALVETDEGYRGRVHAVVVWPGFQGRSDQSRQALVWDALKSKLDEADLLGVSLVMTVAPRDLL